ncbi:MAG: GGDEF domain-containing protein [Candidatus Geothermincolia bacterium]
MDEPIEVIIVEPAESDLALLETVQASGTLRITSAVVAPDGPLSPWLEGRGVEQADDLASVSRLLPGMMVAYMGSGLPPDEVIQRATAHGLSVLSREVFTRLAAPQPGASIHGRTTGEFLTRYRRLLEDYFPSSRSSSTAVKMAACLTEATTIWHAAGGVILTGSQNAGTLDIAAQRGLDMPLETALKIDPGSPIGRSFTRDKHEVIELSGEMCEILPGVNAASAACLAIKPGNTSRGVLLLWSETPAAFSREDISALSLFAYYIAMLLEVDELGDRLGENLVTDPLTGLQNRRQFDQRLRHELLRASRYALNLTLCVFDIDNLAGYNNACGQMLGSLALSDIASILLKGTREVDFVARIGGDEFAAILPETNRLGAVRVAERLRAEVAAYPFPVAEDGASANLTISIGIANFPNVKGTSQDLLQKAHRALDLAKAEGPDTVKLWDEKLEGDGS